MIYVNYMKGIISIFDNDYFDKIFSLYKLFHSYYIINLNHEE